MAKIKAVIMAIMSGLGMVISHFLQYIEIDSISARRAKM